MPEHMSSLYAADVLRERLREAEMARLAKQLPRTPRRRLAVRFSLAPAKVVRGLVR